jgi:two-component system response regulator MprA
LATTDAASAEGKALILVVERNPHVRTLERYFLEQAGYAVEFSDDGVQGLERARSLLPNIVISEILVPRMDGLSVCRALKADPSTRHIVVLIFSILAAAERACEAGADAFLKKPLDDTLLIQSVQQLLDQRQRGAFAHGAP